MAPSKIRRRIKIGCSALVLFVLAVLAVGWMRANHLDRQAQKRWRQVLDNRTFLEAYPPVDINDTALRLVTLAAPLGIDLAPPEADISPTVSEEKREVFKALNESWRPWLAELRKYEGENRPPLSQEVEAFLAQHEDALDELIRTLNSTSPPQWKRDIRNGFSSKLPNLLGILYLQRVLMFEALQRAEAFEDPSPVLEASWRLRSNLHESPYLIEALIDIANLHMQMMALRGSCMADSRWTDRLEATDLRRRVLIGFHHESWVAWWSSHLEQPLGDEQLPGWAKPMNRIGLRDFARRFSRTVEDLPGQAPLTFHSQDFFESHYQAIPRWQVITRLFYPNFFDSWTKAIRAELDADLTARILRVRANPPRALDVRSPRWTEPSRVEGLNWIYERDTDSLTIHLDGQLAESLDETLSLRFEIFQSGNEWSCPPTGLPDATN
ncbi:MAG: hypothetical protein AAF481_01980 [Acidobacteriota bacterium]